MKSLSVDYSRAEPTTSSMKKISFSLKLLSGNFYGQLCTKTVQVLQKIHCKKVSEYDQEIPQSQRVDHPMAL